MKLAWSNLAISELRVLRTYSTERWGAALAARYLADVRDAAKAIAARPDRARPLRAGLRLARVRSHYLIVEVDEAAGQVTIARVLHVAMDLERHLPRPS